MKRVASESPDSSESPMCQLLVLNRPCRPHCAQELPSFFSIVPVAAGTNLTFQVGRGRYDRALQQKGYASASSCARDCTMVSAVAVDPTYCTTWCGTPSTPWPPLRQPSVP